ncbi:MAG TPA: hypothetical protein VMZ03_03745 [Chitinophagaceae bacterium]|nr:hypothetical protein [Chitinophagaceae bacterium]
MSIQNNKKIEEILNSLDGVKRAAAPEFFYTRLKARMEKDLLPAPVRSRILRPAYAFAALVLVLVVNAAVILKNNSGDVVAASEGESIQSLAAEYNLNDVSSLYDLNEDK